MRPLLLLSFVFLLFACGEPASGDARFVFQLQDGLTHGEIAHLEDGLDAAYERILGKLELESVPPVTVSIWQDEDAYQAAMERSLGSRAPGSRGYAFGRDELRLLHHTRSTAVPEAVHEFAHVASLNLNPDFGNNPRWLWEGVAIYLAGEKVDPAKSGIFDDGNCPTLAQLDAPFNNGGVIYAAGYFLIEFIETEWSFGHVVDLVRTNGNLEQSLGVDSDTFERRWCAFASVVSGQRSPD
ncbi:MAG: hypothetical protein AAFU65_14170 [Pseudomonadota bacterium]